MADDIFTGLNNLERILDGIERPGKLKLPVLSHITAKFSDERNIGEGGCGRVFKGILPSGRTVAVKKLFNKQTIDERMFQQEVNAMMSVEHRNIVRFIGYCSHTEQRAEQTKRKRNHILADERERLLCFEYISKGSLEDHVTDELRGLEWHTRFQVIKGICEGLHHLHKEKNIIHMDLKPANILLNDDFVPKITDFGISRPGEISKTVSGNHMFSPQYCAPEYKLYGRMSFKSDIYSLGVIIQEMVTGNREEPNVAMVCRRWRHRWSKSGKHTTLLGWQQVTRCLKLAQRCKNLDNPTERPDIQDIICELSEMDSPCIDISDSSISTVEQKKSFSEDMLGIEPLELHLSAELNKQISDSIQLTNDTDDYVAFGVSATRRLPLCMHPSKDVVPPRSSCIVTITLEALKKPLQERCVSKLFVQSTRVDKDLTTKDLTEDMFKEEPDKVVDVVNLTVSVRAPKQLLVVEPLELRYWPIEPNKLLAGSLQLTNRTYDYVAFTFILPQGKVLCYQTMGTGIMPPCSTRGVVVDMLVKEEALAEMQCKDTCLVRSVVVDKGLRDDDVSLEFFNEQTGVHEMELDIVFAELPQARSPMHRELELTGDRAALISPLSIETELLHMYPAELRFASEEEGEYLSLINKTNDDVIYFIAHCDDDGIYIDDDYEDDDGVVPRQSTRAVLVFPKKKSYQIRVMMISGSRRYRTGDELYINYTYYKREDLMNQVREEGGKAHEALLACVVRAPHPKHEAVVLHMDKNGLGYLYCMDVHPKEPWIVTGHRGTVCIWKMDPETSACETMMSTPNREAPPFRFIKFIARMQWVACGYNGSHGYITVYTYADNRLREIKKFEAHEYEVNDLAVHPSLPYLLSSDARRNLIKLWDWDKEWMCTKKFSTDNTILGQVHYIHSMTFNPKDANTFASVDIDGEINIWSIDSERPITRLRRRTACFAYCNTGSDQCLGTLRCGKVKLEILDLWSNTTTTHVHALEIVRRPESWDERSIACHPTRPLLAISQNRSVLLWNYSTSGLKKVETFDHADLTSGFIDVEGFQRLVIAQTTHIKWWRF